MKTFELHFKYQGAIIECTVLPEENYDGWSYEVTLNDSDPFRVYCDDNGDWSLLRGDNGRSPDIEAELLQKIFSNIDESRLSAS